MSDLFNMPKISVIIPTYNCAETLPEAIGSVLAQSCQDFEIIVVDDGSTDHTAITVESYSEKCAVRYIFQENTGLPGARNRGVDEALGAYVAVLDADDALREDALQVMSDSIENTQADWCIVDILKFWHGFQEIQRSAIPSGDLLLSILADDFIRRGMFFRTSALRRAGLWDASMKNREDWDLNIRMIEGEFPFVYVPQPLYLYRKRPGSITTGSPEKMLRYTEELLRKHHCRLAKGGNPQFKRIYSANMWRLARCYAYQLSSWRSVARCAVESIRYDFDLKRLLHPILHFLVDLRNSQRDPHSKH